MKTMIRGTLVWLFLMTAYVLAIVYPQTGFPYIADLSLWVWSSILLVATVAMMVQVHRIEHGATTVTQTVATDLTKITTTLDGYSAMRKRVDLTMSIILLLTATYSGSTKIALCYLVGAVLLRLSISAARTSLAAYNAATPTPTPAQ